MFREMEDGEISDESERFVPVRFKRRRSSGSSDDQSVYSRGPQREGGHYRQQGWRQEIQDEERDRWLERERMMRRVNRPSISRAMPSERELDIGVPQAHSTAGGAPRAVRYQGAENEVNHQGRTTLGENSSRTFAAKMFKVEPFPKAVKPTDQYQEWIFWLANFEMAAGKAGITDQRARAIDLSLHIGEEMRRIIVAKEMLPRESSVDPGFAFFDNLSNQLEEHFRSLTDESVDVSTFNSLKQGVKETALEFELRLRQMAKRAKETNIAMIRTRYIEGLRDPTIRERAFIDGTPLQEVVKMATRKEAIAQKQQAEFSPWDDDTKAPLVVAAVSRRQGPPGGQERHQQYRHSSFRGESSSGRRMHGNQGQRQPGFQNKWQRDSKTTGTKKEERCGRCGVTEHRNRTCPAENAPCFGCGDIGHFRHMCTKEIRSVNRSNAGYETEVQNEIFD